MADHVPKAQATLDDLRAVPAPLIAELIDGELVTQPRPAALHALAAAALSDELGLPFKRGKGGPGGWIILFEPELHLQQDVLVPDLAGWRRQTMPEIPDVAHFELAPDWVCEVLSPSTEGIDRTKKLRIYAREKVGFVWFINPRAQTLEVLRLGGDLYQLVSTHHADECIRAVPFDAIELELGVLWAR